MGFQVAIKSINSPVKSLSRNNPFQVTEGKHLGYLFQIWQRDSHCIVAHCQVLTIMHVVLIKAFMAVNGLKCADVPLRNYSLTHSLTLIKATECNSSKNCWQCLTVSQLSLCADTWSTCTCCDPRACLSPSPRQVTPGNNSNHWNAMKRWPPLSYIPVPQGSNEHVTT